MTGESSAALVQIVLPIRDNAGRRYSERIWRALKRELVDRFGGVTAYARAPAEGVWAPTRAAAARKDVFILEVMVGKLDRRWWRGLRHELEARLAQKEIVIRALPLMRL